MIEIKQSLKIGTVFLALFLNSSFALKNLTDESTKIAFPLQSGSQNGRKVITDSK